LKNVLESVCGPVQIEEGWSERNNDELEKLMTEEDIVKYIRAQRIEW
jgi:hypothetical protein